MCVRVCVCVYVCVAKYKQFNNYIYEEILDGNKQQYLYRIFSELFISVLTINIYTYI